jgi:hypothetical protein
VIAMSDVPTYIGRTVLIRGNGNSITRMVVTEELRVAGYGGVSLVGTNPRTGKHVTRSTFDKYIHVAS